MRSCHVSPRRAAAVLLVLGLGVALSTGPVLAQIKKGKERLAETKYLMKGGVQPNCAGIGAALKGSGPKDDKAWEVVICQASVLNELGHALMADGRCPDKTWADASKTLRECSAKVAEAAREKKRDEAEAAFKAMVGACSACHKAHKGK